ncbi:hypothetical protein BDR03DRAFT_1018635 [Suillus americanus]|nr:hypothetical protein BDR03DRAFT_1018635 [Suillus americanus]
MLTNHPPKSPITLPQSFITSFSHSPPIFSLFSCSHCTGSYSPHSGRHFEPWVIHFGAVVVKISSFL